MEECVNQGLAKSIGISNFNSQQIERLLENCKVKPVVNQVELNPNLNQKKLTKFCSERGIVITAYCPLGRPEEAGIRGFTQPTIQDPKVIDIAKKHNKTPAQIVLNYLVNFKFYKEKEVFILQLLDFAGYNCYSKVCDKI